MRKSLSGGLPDKGFLFFAGTVCEGGGSGADLEKYRGEVHCAKHCDEPLKAKIVSAMASTIFESHLHCLEWNWNVLFCSLGRSTLLVMTVAPVRGFLPNRKPQKRLYLFVCSGMIFFDRHKKRKTALLIQLLHYCFLK